ncbi:c-type cytochrome [Undibacterium sp.]|uniref:c-type cytochrome n=1 Tax=Undibacterium sp. TaxID=1914977 RepID=UPI0025E0313D|nr:c-type cytochrome [Undibacterium sp.]
MKKNTLLALLLSVSSFAAIAGGNIEAGKLAAEKFNCASCHGANYSTPIDPSYPKLAGQHKDYLAQALKAYQRGTDGAYGRGNAIMGAQAKALSNTDIQNISAYIHSLPGSLVLQK